MSAEEPQVCVSFSLQLLHDRSCQKTCN